MYFGRINFRWQKPTQHDKTRIELVDQTIPENELSWLLNLMDSLSFKNPLWWWLLNGLHLILYCNIRVLVSTNCRPLIIHKHIMAQLQIYHTVTMIMNFIFQFTHTYMCTFVSRTVPLCNSAQWMGLCSEIAVFPLTQICWI